MRSFLTLIWEQWRQTWRGLALIVGALVGYWLLLVLVEPLIFIIFSRNPRIALSAAYVPVAGAMGLLFMQESRSEIGFAYPRRMFWLPVRTYTLVGAQFVYKIVIIAMLSLAAGWICQTEIKPTFSIVPEAVLFTGLTAALLGMVFLVCGYGTGTGLALFVPAAAISLIGFEPVYAVVTRNFISIMPPGPEALAQLMAKPESPEYLYFFPNISAWTWWSAAIGVAWWAIVSYIAARHARSDVPGDSVGRWVRMVSNLAYLDREGDGFASPEAAHRWFEWRRVIYLYPWITLVLGLVMVGVSRSSMEVEENKFIVGFSLMAVAPAVVAVLIGYAMTRPDPRYMWFVGGRPLTSSAISRARIVVSIKAISIAYALSFIAYSVVNVVLFESWNPINALVNDLQLITSTYGTSSNGYVMLGAALWIGMIVTWSLFWLGRSAGVFTWVAGILAAAYFYLDGREPLVRQGVEKVVSPVWIVFGGTLTVIMVVCVLVTYGWAIRRKLLSPKLLPVLVAVGAISTWAVFQFQLVQSSSDSMVPVLIWLLLPLAPFATVPATLSWQRHR